MYQSGEAENGNDFLSKAMRIAWETFKGGAVGAAMGGAGVAAKAVLPVAAGAIPAVARGTGITAAEVTAMATTAAALEARLPSAQDFMDGAILIGGLKAAGAVSKRMMKTYEKTGKTPIEQVADAQRDPTIKEDLTAPVPKGEEQPIPRAYEPIAADQRVRAAVPDAMTDERHALNIAAVLKNPEGEITPEKVDLQRGVVHYPGTAKAGQAGNFFVTGHSSYYPWSPGKFKTVFARLGDLQPGDEYWVYYGGDKHRYTVTDKKEVKPSNVDVLNQPVGKRTSTLMTCTPVGTTLRRLIITADEVDPVTGIALEVGEQPARELPEIKMEVLPI